MKKLLIVMVLAAVAFSCGTPKTVIQAKKEVKGYWSLDNISYSEPGTFNVTVFNDTSKECFEGSTWQFIPNNNTGMYTIKDSDCLTGDRHFVFTIQAVDAETGHFDFLLKPTNEKHKSETNKGFRQKILTLSETVMQWQQTVTVEGKPFIITMTFNKL